MITMEMLGKVKRLYSRDKKSLHAIAKTTGLSRNTISLLHPLPNVSMPQL